MEIRQLSQPAKKWATVDAAPTFRGSWSPLLDTPAKVKPKPKLEPEVVAAMEEDDEYRPPPVAAPVEEVVIETHNGELLEEPPSDADVLCTVLDRKRDFRAYIAEDGEVVANSGQVIGYINIDDCQVGSADMEYLGCGKIGADETQFTILDSNDVELCDLDLGSCRIKEDGTTIAEIDGSGAISGHAGSFLGEIEGFGYAHTKIIALYLCLLDTGMLNEVEG